MNTTMLHRLIWKEFRTLRPLWVTLLVAAVLLQVGLMGFFDAWGARWQWLSGVMLTIPTMYALASATMTFAGEREEGTDQFLSRLAVPPGVLLVVKVGLCVLTTITMFGILYPWTHLLLKLATIQSTVTLGDIALDLPNHVMTAIAWTAGFLSFGTFFSVVLRRVLPTLIATTVATTLCPLIVHMVLKLNLDQRAGWTDRMDWTRSQRIRATDRRVSLY